MRKTDGKDHLSRFRFCALAPLIIAFFLSHATAAQVTVAWDANPEADLAGYKIYYKTGSSGPPYDGIEASEGQSPITIPLAELGDPASPEYTLHGLSDTERTFSVVSAYDTEGNESGYSNEVVYDPMSPLGIPPLDIKDCNDDGTVTSADVTCTIIEIFDPIGNPVADCNGDGRVTSADVTCTILCTLGMCP